VLHSLFPPPLPLTRTQVAEISGQPIAAVSPEAVFARTRFANDKSLSVGIAADGKSAKSSSAGNSYAILGTPCGQVSVCVASVTPCLRDWNTHFHVSTTNGFHRVSSGVIGCHRVSSGVIVCRRVSSCVVGTCVCRASRSGRST
jgi:hypothetical protein